MLLDTAPRLLPELDPRLSKTADRVLRRRGVQVRTGQSVTKAMPGYVILSTGEQVPTRCLIWCVGVRPDPLVDGLNLKTDRGRLVVDEFMSVPGAPDNYACGDCAAVPDLTRQERRRLPRQGHREALRAPRRGLSGRSGRGRRRREPAQHPALRAGRQCRHPRLSPNRDVW
jgi:NADH dehydrogenase